MSRGAPRVSPTGKGLLFAVVAALLWGVDPLFAQRALRRGTPAQVVFWTLVVASALLLFAHAALMGLAPLTAVSSPTLTAFVLAGGTNYLLGRTFYFSSIRDVGPARSVPISSTYPLFAATFAVLGLGEILTLRRALGVLLVVGGILCITTERAGR